MPLVHGAPDPHANDIALPGPLGGACIESLFSKPYARSPLLNPPNPPPIFFSDTDTDTESSSTPSHIRSRTNKLQSSSSLTDRLFVPQQGKDSALSKTTRPLPSWVLLDSAVRVAPGAVEKEAEWAIKCTDRQAYLYAWRIMKKASRALVRDITLLARLAEPPDLSSLYIRLAAGKSGGQFLRTSVMAVDNKIIVLTTTLPDDCGAPYFYLIYDSTKTSLSMIPHLPSFCPPSFTTQPLLVRRGDGDGDGGDYSLAIMARCSLFDKKRRDPDFLCLWPPPCSAKPLPPSIASKSIEPWRV
uniref:DUF1618 domain-containing protein n=1 Tax=Leersia perrieri TaxID=77586 RepID=A0A0D9W7U8_9ORYZ